MKAKENEGGLLVFIKVFTAFTASLKMTNRCQVVLEPTPFLSS
jgi:hypothetical protein